MSLADIALSNAGAMADIRDSIVAIEVRLARIEGGLKLGAWLTGTAVVLFAAAVSAHVIR